MANAKPVTILGMLWLLALSACTSKLERYYETVDQAERFVINYTETGKEVSATYNDATYFKKLLKRNIETELPRNFAAQTRIRFYKGGTSTAAIIINGRYANFMSDSLTFTFRLTYGLGRWIAEAERR